MPYSLGQTRLNSPFSCLCGGVRSDLGSHEFRAFSAWLNSAGLTQNELLQAPSVTWRQPMLAVRPLAEVKRRPMSLSVPRRRYRGP